MKYSEKDDPLTYRIIGLAIEVHKHLGPGLLESSYQQCLSQELRAHEVEHFVEARLPIQYKEHTIEDAYRVDLLIPGKLIIELKSIKAIEDIHKAQLITYLKLSSIKTGLLNNFNVTQLTNGIHRLQN